MNSTADSIPKWLEKVAAYPQRAILLFSLTLLLAGNWILPLTDRDETRFSEASREMIQRHDYVVPWFNGHWRFDKPALIYWCQSASYRVFGDNEFGARLPSALFTAATALLLVRWGRKITGNNLTALMAGVMFVACLHVAVIGRAATADMALVFFYTLSVWSGWELTRPDQPPRRRWWWIFYVALALGFLAKGPEAGLPLAGMILGRAVRKASFRLPLVETVAGVGVALFLVCLWGIPALLQTQGAYFDVGIGEHVVNRSLSVNDSHGLRGTLGFWATLPMYFVTFFVSFFPWSPRVPGALRRWWPERKRDDIGWYLLIQALIIFGVFSLVHTKLPHYTMPAFPCLALWFARQLRRSHGSYHAWFGKRMVAMTLFILALTLGGFTFARNYFLTENLWNAVKPRVRPETKVGCFGFVEPSLVWKFRGVSTNYVVLGELKSAGDFLTNTPPFILVLPTEQLARLPDTNGILISVHGLDVVGFKHHDLTAIVRP
jgi:4-amino-4-deoxy-L-arabinose transferase-like glycosyltransferase